MYWLVNVAPRKVNVTVFGYTSLEEDVVVWRPEKVPNRDSAMIKDQRSAAQYGQYSAPR